ncbi:MAG: ATP-binding protein [Isosphaeraceae bacterium]
MRPGWVASRAPRPADRDGRGRGMGPWDWGLIGCVVGAVAVAAAWAVASWGHRSAIADLERALGALSDGRPIRSLPSGPPGSAVGRLSRRFHEVIPDLIRRMAEHEQDHQQMRAVLAGMAEGVLAIDHRKRLLFANPTAVRLFGLTTDAMGRPLAELIRALPIQEALEAPLNGSGAYRREVVVRARDASGNPGATVERVLNLRGSPLPGSQPGGSMLVIRDVTELRHLERMRQDFVANASHELKTPLAAIKAYTETLLDWGLEEPELNVKLLNNIDEQADRLHQLILDLLSLARLESGQDPFDHHPIELLPQLREIVENHRDRAEAKDLAYIVDLQQLPPATIVRADEEALRQILDNLIDNAIKYTNDGGQVRFDARTEAGEVVLSVADTGAGIPQTDLHRIFERFYRVDRARSRELGGTGLGLSIVKHLVQSLGGTIDVTSRLGTGSRFAIRLPILSGAADPKGNRQKTA